MSDPINPKRLILNLLRAADGAPLSSREAATACALFGIRESAVRVALVRLSSAGLIEAEGRGSYRLGSQAEPLAEDVSHWQAAEARVCDWDGGWLMVCTGGLGRSDRSVLNSRNRSLALGGFRELEPTIYLRPDNLVGHATTARERLHKLGLDDSAPVFSVQDLDLRREHLARRLWNGAALNASYHTSRKKLEQWMKRSSKIDLDVAARESFLLGNDAIRQLIFDPMLPEPLVDVSARRGFTEVVKAFDQLGHTIWQRLLSRVPATGRRPLADQSTTH